jgi:hypothetical protein
MILLTQRTKQSFFELRVFSDVQKLDDAIFFVHVGVQNGIPLTCAFRKPDICLLYTSDLDGHDDIMERPARQGITFPALAHEFLKEAALPDGFLLVFLVDDKPLSRCACVDSIACDPGSHCS